VGLLAYLPVFKTRKSAFDDGCRPDFAENIERYVEAGPEWATSTGAESLTGPQNDPHV